MSRDLAALNTQIERTLYALGQEGLLDDQFAQLVQLQDEGTPDFVAEVVQLYFEDSAGKLEKLEAKLAAEQPDYGEVDQLVHQFKGSSASFGAHAVAWLCVELRTACTQHNRGGCQQLMVQLRQSFQQLKERLGVFMELEARRKQLAGAPGAA